MSRFAAQSRVLFWEEPCLVEGLPEPDLHIDVCATSGVIVIPPQLPADGAREEDGENSKHLLDLFLTGESGPFVRRSEERRVGKECVSTCRSRWSPDP